MAIVKKNENDFSDFKCNIKGLCG